MGVNNKNFKRDGWRILRKYEWKDEWKCYGSEGMDWKRIYRINNFKVK